MRPENYKPELFDVEKSIKSQDEYCKDNSVMLFAPYDGECFYCGRQIYEARDLGDEIRGYTTKEASETLITGCPFCHRSYVD